MSMVKVAAFTLKEIVVKETRKTHRLPKAQRAGKINGISFIFIIFIKILSFII